MNKEENPIVTPAEYEAELKESIRLVKKTLKFQNKIRLKGAPKYHTTLRNLNAMIADFQNELVDLYKLYPELKTDFRTKLKQGWVDLTVGAGQATRS